MDKNDQEYLVQKIRTQYVESKMSPLDSLKRLDTKVKRPVNIFTYVFGSLGAIILGAGMSLIMTDIGKTIGVASPMAPGVVIGVIGMLMAIANYPIYKSMMNSRRKKYKEQIMKLSDTIMNP